MKDWYKFLLSYENIYDTSLKLIKEFGAFFNAATDSQVNGAVILSKVHKQGAMVFFSPKAAIIAKPLIEMNNAVLCESPSVQDDQDGHNLSFLAGDRGFFEQLFYHNNSISIKSGSVSSTSPELVTLPDLIRMAQPLLDMYTHSQEEQQKQEFEHDLKVHQIFARHKRSLLLFLFVISLMILGITFYLYTQNKDAAATNLIQLVVALGGAAFGGYGWATSKPRLKDDEK